MPVITTVANPSWVFREPTVGQTPIAATTAAPSTSVNSSTVAAGTLMTSPGPAGRSTPGRLGSIAKAYHPTFGEGEFIYLLGVLSTVAGLLVNYNTSTYQTTITPNTANNEDPVAVAMSANVAGQYGWYQITGIATVLKTATQVLPGSKIYQSATVGRVMPTSASGKQILGARGANLTTVTTTTSTVVVLLNRPYGQGQVT
jgi:hypothetical protein